MGPPDVYSLLTREMDAVYRLAYHLAARPHEADDLVQETYHRAFRAADKFRLTEHGPRPWLFKILHNVLATRYQSDQREGRLRRRLQEGDDGVARDGAARDPDVHAAPHAGLADLPWDAVDERLKRALDALPMPARITFLLHAVEGLKYREIAEVTEVPVGTVMSRLSRAREELTRHLGDYAREQGWSKPPPAPRGGRADVPPAR